jgi:hypothetical protein
MQCYCPLLLVPCMLSTSATLKMETGCSSETSVNSMGLHSITSQKTVLCRQCTFHVFVNSFDQITCIAIMLNVCFVLVV